MGILIALKNNQKARIKVLGKTLDLLTLLVSISKYLLERISKENGVSIEKAEDIIVDCIKDGMKTVEE